MRSIHACVIITLTITALLSVGGCADPKAGQPTYDMACDTNDVESGSVWKCVRINTRTGAAVYVDIDKLSKSVGRATTKYKKPGVFSVHCNSTSVKTSAKFRCIRLNRVTGKMEYLDVDNLKVAR